MCVKKKLISNDVHIFFSNLFCVVFFVGDPMCEKCEQLVTCGPFITQWMSLSSYSTNEEHVSQINLQIVVSIIVIAR